MEDKIPAIKSAVIGINHAAPFGKRSLAAETVCIFYADGTAEIVDVSNYSLDNPEQLEAKKAEMTNIHNFINNSIKNKKNYKTLYSDSKDFQEVLARAHKIMAGKKSNKLKTALATGAILLGGAVLGVGGKALYDHLTEDKAIETSVEDDIPAVPDMEGKDFSFYAENAIDTEQKQLVLGINNFLSQVNGKEDWTKVTLTEEQMKQYNLTDPECLFGFTAEDMYALALRFGHYSNEDYVTLTSGTGIDTVSIMDDAHSQSNGTLSSIISYYVCSDECDLNIENIINFNETEVAKINEIEGLLREYKVLEKTEDKEKEAEAKMIEIKDWFNEYAYAIDYEQDNAKSYILRTMLPACSIISEMHQYKDTIEVTLYDTKKDINVPKEIKTDLFDEITMRNLVLGYNESEAMGAFSAEAFLEEHDIDEKRYNLLNTDVERSIADQSVSGQLSRLEEANEYIATLRSENIQAESAAYFAANQEIVIDSSKDKVGEQAAVQLDQMNNVETAYDKLTYGTYEPTMLLEMVNNNLKENNIYPNNINYFRTAKIAEMQIAYKDTHGVTAGKKGDTIKTENHGKVTLGSVKVDPSVTKHVILDENGNETTLDALQNQAKDEYVEDTGISDASTPDASEKADEEAEIEAQVTAEMLQGIYNATFNYYNGGAVVVDGFDTSNTYGQSFTTAWATSSDPRIVAQYNNGMADGLKFKSDREKDGTTIGGETIINPEFNGVEISDTPKAPVNSVDNTTKPDANVNTNTGDNTNNNTDTNIGGNANTGDNTNNNTVVIPSDGVTINPEFEGAEIYDTPQAPVESVDNTTKPDNTVKEGITSEAPTGFAPVVDSNTVVNTTSTYTIDPAFIDVFTDNEINAYLNSKEGNDFLATVTADTTIQKDVEPVTTQEFTSEAPTGFAPVVNDTVVTVSTGDSNIQMDFDSYLNSEEGMKFLQSVTATDSVSEVAVQKVKN